MLNPPNKFFWLLSSLITMAKVPERKSLFGLMVSRNVAHTYLTSRAWPEHHGGRCAWHRGFPASEWRGSRRRQEEAKVCLQTCLQWPTSSNKCVASTISRTIQYTIICWGPDQPPSTWVSTGAGGHSMSEPASSGIFL